MAKGAQVVDKLSEKVPKPGKTLGGISNSSCRKRLHKNSFGDFGDTSAIRIDADEEDKDSYHSLS